jgi:tripartite-type tricarboxylate transporter receptor subunit TctC
MQIMRGSVSRSPAQSSTLHHRFPAAGWRHGAIVRSADRLTAVRFRLEALLIVMALAGPAAAEPFPDHPVRMVLPYPVGGSFDVIARPLALRFEELAGSPLVIDNRGGANGMIAADLVAKARPDGYTLLMASAGPVTIAPALYPTMSYDPRTDLVPVSALVSIPYCLFERASFEPRTVADIVAAARAQPGTIAVGLPGNGSVGHLAEAMFAQATGTRFLAVPYRGAPEVLTDMMSGSIALTFTSIASARPALEAGALRAVAIAAARRTAAMPALPTFAELGLPQVEAALWIGVMAPAGTPPPVIRRLNALLLDTLAHPSIRNAAASVGADILGKGPDGFAALLREDYPRWAEAVRRGHVTVE